MSYQGIKQVDEFPNPLSGRGQMMSAKLKIGLQKIAPNHSFDFFIHYSYIAGALHRILSPRRKSRIFEIAILKISQYSSM